MSEQIPVSANRVGIFVTFLSLLAAIVGLGLFLFADYNSHALKAVAGILFWIGVVGVLFSFLVVRLYFWTFRPNQVAPRPPRQPVFVRRTTEPKGIGGWLFFPILGMVLAPLWAVVSIARSFEVLLNLSTYPSLFQSLVIVETTAIVFVSIIAPVYLIGKLNSKSQYFPRRYIQWMFCVAAFVVLDTLAIYLMFKEQVDAGKLQIFDNETIRAWSQAIVGILVWVPYMLKSRRVRNTFVEPV